MKIEKAIFAAGCFWGVEESFRKIPGVIKTTVGYTGGCQNDPTYNEVVTGRTGHVEAVLVEFDDDEVSYAKLLDIFWQIHDPTTLNRQGPDVGSNYRSAIFYQNGRQQDLAENSKKALESSGNLKKLVVTEIAPAGTFWPAEEYHQQYLLKNREASCSL